MKNIKYIKKIYNNNKINNIKYLYKKYNNNIINNIKNMNIYMNIWKKIKKIL